MTCPTVIVELGAGKGFDHGFFLMIDSLGGLSRTLVDEIDQSGIVKYVLVDRSNSRRKKDAQLKNMSVPFERIHLDISDVDFSLLIGPEVERVIFVGKHLCGGATCMSLSAIESLRKDQPKL